MEVDFGGFGIKEYATDRAASVLTAHGIQHGYVNLGGDVHVVGPQFDGQPWLIGIQTPQHKGQMSPPFRCGQEASPRAGITNGSLCWTGATTATF